MYKVEITGGLDSSFNVKSKNYQLVIDTKGKGITPPETLLASLGTCIGVYIRKYAEGTKLTLGEFSITVEAEFCKEKPFYFKVINVLVNLKGTRLDENRKKALVMFVKNCPIHNTLKNISDVDIKIR
jgi:uncharacterized OsmC-like protein